MLVIARVSHSRQWSNYNLYLKWVSAVVHLATELQCMAGFEAWRRLLFLTISHCPSYKAVIGPSLMLLPIHGTVCPNVSQRHTLLRVTAYML